MKRYLMIGILAAVAGAGLARAEDKSKDKLDDVPPEKLSTNMDFDSTMIDGKMKAPAGFFLQGRNKQSLTNMVKLRSNFKPQLQESKTAVKALVK